MEACDKATSTATTQPGPLPGLDAADHAHFDRWARHVADAFEVPVVGICVIHAPHVWFVGRCGADVCAEHHDGTQCAAVQCSGRGVEIADVTQVGALAPACTRAHGIRFYVALPLFDQEGRSIGVIHLKDFVRHDLDDAQRQRLQLVAELVGHDLGFRLGRPAEQVSCDTPPSASAHETTDVERALLLTQESVERASDAIFWISPDGRFKHVNRAACRSLGYPQDQLLEMTVWDVDANVTTASWATHWESLKVARTLKFESTHKHRNGERFPVEVVANFLEFDGEEYNFAFVRDIQDRKLLEGKIQEGIQASHVINETATAFVTAAADDVQETVHDALQRVGELLSADSVQIVWTPTSDVDMPQTMAWRRDAGFAMPAELGETCVRRARWLLSQAATHDTIVIGTLEEVGGVSAGLRECLETLGVASALVAPMLIGDQRRGLLVVGREAPGRPWPRSSMVLLRTVGHVIAGALDRGASERSLQRSEERFRALFEQLATGFSVKQIVCDNAGAPVDFRYLEVNPAWQQMLGVSADEIVGRLASEVYPEVRDACIGAFGCVALTGRPEQFELYYERTQRHLAVLVFRTTADTFATLVTDITERKETEARLVQQTERLHASNIELQAHQQQLQAQQQALKQFNVELEAATEAAQAASRAKSDFLTNMSHEIRTPMTAIMGYAEVLQESLDDPQACAEYIETIRRNGQHLLGIINSILDLTKIEAGELNVAPRTCPLAGLVDGTLSTMRSEAQRKSLTLDVEYAGSLPQTIRTDPTRLRQILDHVVGNALKFTEFGGVHIVVGLRTDDDRPRLAFTVRDTGIGMTAEEVAALFRPFTQADGGRARRFGGTGLGLTIAKRLAVALGGDINVQSQPRQGTSVEVTIDPGPLANGGAAPATAAPTTPNALRGRVLLAEDGPDNQKLLKRILTKAGLAVDLAENGVVACELAVAADAVGRPYDIILMDMQMPEMDGYAATRKLRELGFELPIVAVTAHAMVGDREHCLEAGCTDYMTKPVNRTKLLTLIADLLPASVSA